MLLMLNININNIKYEIMLLISNINIDNIKY